MPRIIDSLRVPTNLPLAYLGQINNSLHTHLLFTLLHVKETHLYNRRLLSTESLFLRNKALLQWAVSTNISAAAADTLLFTQPDHLHILSLGAAFFSSSFIIFPAARSQQFPSNNARRRATKGEKTVGKQTKSRLNNCGLFGVWGKHNLVVCVCVCVRHWLQLWIMRVCAHVGSKHQKQKCLSSMHLQQAAAAVGI